MTAPLYLDNNATTPVAPEALRGDARWLTERLAILALETACEIRCGLS